MDLKILQNIPSSFLLAKKALLICFLVSIMTVIGSLSWAFYVAKTFTKTTFIITEKGQATIAKSMTSSQIDTYRNPEIKNHIKVFHKLFWEYDQFSYERKINEALYLIGSSGKEMYLSLKAKGHFSQIQTQNLIQKITIDSIKIDEKSTPYHGVLYGELKVMRTDQKSEENNRFFASFDLYNVSRTEKNPHGLLIENYLVKKVTN